MTTTGETVKCIIYVDYLFVKHLFSALYITEYAIMRYL